MKKISSDLIYPYGMMYMRNCGTAKCDVVFTIWHSIDSTIHTK